MEITACTRAAMSLGYDLKKTLENAKKQDFMGTLLGLVTITQEVGALEVCGLKLDKTALINSLHSLCPRHWDVIQDQLAVFGEEAYRKVMGPPLPETDSY